MDKAREATETIRDFLNQFDPDDQRTALILDLLFKVIYNIPSDESPALDKELSISKKVPNNGIEKQTDTDQALSLFGTQG